MSLPSPVRAGRFGVPTNLNAAGEVCLAAGTPAGCVAPSANPPGWFVLERLDSGSTNGDVVKQIRLFIEVTGSSLDVRVFDAGLSGARDLGRPVDARFRLLDPTGAPVAGSLTLGADTVTTGNRLARFACQDAAGPVFRTLDTAPSATNRVWGQGSGSCAPLAAGLYVFEVTIQGSTGNPTYEARNAFGVEILDGSGSPYNVYTIGQADDTLAPPSATDTSAVVGAVAGDRPAAGSSGPVVLYPFVDRGCGIEAGNFDLDVDNAEGTGAAATLFDTLGASSNLTGSGSDDVASTLVAVEPDSTANLEANNYGMFRLETRLGERAPVQNHVDWRVADFQGSTAGSPANYPRHPVSPLRTYLPNDYADCGPAGCTFTAPGEPILAASALYVSGEDPPQPGGSATRFWVTATVGNEGPTAITDVQITFPYAAGVTLVSGSGEPTVDGVAATCTDTSTATYLRCTFASLAAGSYASVGFEIDFQPPANGLQNLIGAPTAGSPPPDTTLWAQYTPASQSASFPRTETVGPLCQMAVNVPVSVDVDTRTLVDTPDPVVAGSTLQYRIRVRNLDLTNAAPNPSWSDVLPAGTTFVSITGPGDWTCVTPPVGQGGTVTCSAATIPANDTTGNFRLNVQVDSDVPNGTLLNNTVTTTIAAVDPDLLNNTLTATTTVVAPAADADLGVSSSDAPDPVPAGQDLTYTLSVANGGPATALSVTLTDGVPASTTFRSISTPPGWTCATPPVGGTGTVSCGLDSLLAGTSSVLTLRVRVDPGAPPSGVLSNTATVASAVNDPVPANNSATATTTVAAAGTCPTPGQDGDGGTLGGIVNTYYSGTGTVSAGSTSLTLGPARGAASTIAAGDLLLIVQMQDAAIDSSDTDAYGDGTAGDGEARGATDLVGTGLYEYAVAANAVPASGGALTVTSGLLNSYTAAAPTNLYGQRTWQVVRVPQYTTATLGSTLTAAYWDGGSGGVLALDVEGVLDLGGATVDVSGRGFRGGGARQLGGADSGSATAYVDTSARSYHASKGEGVAGTPRYIYAAETQSVVDTGDEGYPRGSFARGAPGTAGGGGTDANPSANDQNTGGGGGGNGGLGGGGGYAWTSASPVGGFGGDTIPSDALRMTLGGGGGAGSRNGSTGDQSSGAGGGGIVMIRADSLSGSGAFVADGLSANTSDTTPADDGGGGGGAGGSVLVYAPSGGFGGLSVSAGGGSGSDAWPPESPTAYPGNRHGPGGGGGGGRVFLSGTAASVDVGGGAAGTTTLAQDVFGATDGNPGTVAGLTLAQVPGIDTTGACGAIMAAVADLGLKVTGPEGEVDACRTATYVFTVANIGPDPALSPSFSAPVPTGTTFQSYASDSGWACSTPGGGGTGTVTCSGPTLDVFAVVNITLSVGVDCAAPVGSVIGVDGLVSTTSADPNSVNDSASTANLVGPSLLLATRASIRGVRVDPAGRVEFATGWQKGTRGFHVYMTDDPSGRRRLVRLTGDLLLSPRPDSQLPILYSIDTLPVTAPYVVIVEHERSGRKRRMGPFPVGDERQAALLSRAERRLEEAGDEARWDTARSGARFLAPRRRAGTAAWIRAAREVAARNARREVSLAPRRGSSALRGVKIETLGEGLVSVPRTDLEAAGLPSRVRLSSCRLDSQGREVAFTVDAEGTPAEALRFRTEPLLTAYAGRSVFVLTWRGRPPRMDVALTSEADPRRPGWMRVDRPVLFVPHVPRGTDPWLWDALFPGYGPWPYDWDPTAGTFDLPGWPGHDGAVAVRLRFQGMTPSQHRASVTLNGEPVGTVSFEGMRSATLEGTVSMLRGADNSLHIDYEDLGGDPYAFAYLDYLEVQTPSTYTGGPVAARVLPWRPASPRGGADYLIVTHPSFATQAARLARAKRHQGFRVDVVEVDRLYDRYSGGVPEAMAVQAAIRHAASRGHLRYVLLLGDDSFDPDDRAGFGGRTFVPSLYGWDGEFGRVGSENRYADLDDDGRPDLAIGRLPASTPSQADALVAKVERQQQLLLPGLGRHVFAVDDGGPGDPDFQAAALEALDALPGTVRSSWADLSAGAATARAQLFDALARGAAFTHYFGHGGPEAWADEGLLTVEDAASLPTTGTVVLTWSCLAQFYQYLWGPSVNESLLLQPDRGAVAAFGPDGITAAPLQALLYERLYEELARGRVSLGEAIRRAKSRAIADEPLALPVVEGWNLLGDPSLVVDVSGTTAPPTRRRPLQSRE